MLDSSSSYCSSFSPSSSHFLLFVLNRFERGYQKKIFCFFVSCDFRLFSFVFVLNLHQYGLYTYTLTEEPTHSTCYMARTVVLVASNASPKKKIIIVFIIWINLLNHLPRFVHHYIRLVGYAILCMISPIFEFFLHLLCSLLSFRFVRSSLFCVSLHSFHQFLHRSHRFCVN